jgi:hypothetical protein
MRHEMKLKIRILFPFGFFLSALLIFEGLALSGTVLFFYFNMKQDIRTMEREARTYLMPLLDVCARTAAIGSDADVSSALTPAFTEYQTKAMVYRAFFVKENGAILAHSNPAEIASLKNNIAHDEFTYNLDQIFLPLKMKEENPVFIDYYIPEIKLPFDKKKTAYIKKYVYDEVDKNGWLIAKAVFRNDKPYGLVAFILEKTPIYRAIQDQYTLALYWCTRTGILAAAAALLISCFMYLRYRSLVNKGLNAGALVAEEPAAVTTTSPVISAVETEKRKPERVYIDDGKKTVASSIILDAIPLKKK